MHQSVADAHLLRQYVGSRSQEAFAELVRRYVDLVYTSPRRQVHEPTLAEDVTQQVPTPIPITPAQPPRRGNFLTNLFSRPTTAPAMIAGKAAFTTQPTPDGR